ncbi:hypothetical protein KY360_03175 [Candidatus Woesearchaeota archaeon]|nr:hypothetical protein [Candidatus Woesearchaeota archaeon]
MPKKRLLPVYIGIFLISAATLIFEVSLTRIFSVIQWHHFAFMVISIALLGFGASGTFLSISGLLKKDINKLLAGFSLALSISIILGFFLANQIPFDPFRIVWDKLQLLYISVYYITLAIPFFCAGCCIAAALSKLSKDVNKIYFSDLFGAGIGSLSVILLFSLLNINIIIVSALLAAIACILFSLDYRKKIILPVIWIIILLCSPLVAPLKINISPYKSLSITLNFPDSELLFTGWNSFSRVDVIRSSTARYAPGISYKFSKALPEQLALTVDGDSLNVMTKAKDMEFIDFLPSSLAYKLQQDKKVLIIEPGAGFDVLAAAFYNKSITVTEKNPIIIDLVKNKYNEFVGGLYQSLDLNLIEARSYLRETKEKFDIIQLSLAGHPISSSTGLYGLNENYLFTVEAFEDYYEHLGDSGILTITRYLMFPPRESVRIVSLAIKALENKNIANAQDHIALIRTLTTTTFLLKRSEFNENEIEQIRNFCDENEFDIIYVPGIRKDEINRFNKLPEPHYYQMIAGLFENREQLYDEYLFDITPVTDDKPYFFNFFRWSKLALLYESMGKKWEPFFEGGFIVNFVLVQAVLLSFVLILLPIYRFKKIKKKIIGKNRLLAYFFCIGIAFIFIEIALIQKFILFLGHPIYAISTVLFSVLIFAGIGAYFSKRFKLKKLRAIIPALSILILIYLASIKYIFNLFIGNSIIIKIILSAALIAPLAYLMGNPFPLGIRLADRINNKLIPWAWAVNGCASVLSSVLAVIIAMALGFRVVLFLASIFYLLGLIFALKLIR